MSAQSATVFLPGLKLREAQSLVQGWMVYWSWTGDEFFSGTIFQGDNISFSTILRGRGNWDVWRKYFCIMHGVWIQLNTTNESRNAEETKPCQWVTFLSFFALTTDGKLLFRHNVVTRKVLIPSDHERRSMLHKKTTTAHHHRDQYMFRFLPKYCLGE